MNFDMFSNKQNDEMDPNYIYPRPYVDPMMYLNPYTINNISPQANQMDSNMSMNMNGYMAYMNPYMYNPTMCQEFHSEPMETQDEYEEEQPQTQHNNMHGMYGMNPMMPGMPPMMFPNMMMNPMMSGMMPPMMFPNMMMPPHMMPYMSMMPGMPSFNMEEFDEEEM